MSLETILSRLTKVKGRNNSYTACCPAHNDRNPSLAIRETEDGRILLKCFSGCSAEEILSAISLDMDQLFPERLPNHRYQPEKPRFYSSDLMKLLEFEALVVAVAANQLSKNEPLSETDMNRMKVAHNRIMEVIENVKN
jgi:hypothetical protein